MPDEYNLSVPLPQEVLENVTLFVEGKATFYELPRKQGRRNRVVKTLIESETGNGSKPIESGGTGSTGVSVRIGGGSDGLGSKKSIGSKRPLIKIPTVSRIRRIPNKAASDSGGKSVVHTTGDVKKEVEVSKVLPATEPTGTEVAVKRKRGRPRRVT